MRPVIDRAELRRRLAGWRPRMTIEVEVQALTALLDDMDACEAKLEELRACLRGLLARGASI